MYVNANKIQCGHKKVVFLGYDVSCGFCWDTYVQQQQGKLPKVSSRTEICRILGIFYVCTGSCLDLAKWVKPLHDMLKFE